ncbi:MAG: response regulator [Balneolaceae bacterium]|nr:MAG: response regulator [Balneolaceae bacterium]
MSKELLLVDDDRIFNLLHTRFFEKAGVNPSVLKSFRGGDECIAYLDDHTSPGQTTFLVLLDITMPVMDGWDFLEELQSRSYKDNILVVMVSSSVDGADKEKAKTYSQVLDYVEKPLSPQFIEQLKSEKRMEGLFAG